MDSVEELLEGNKPKIHECVIAVDEKSRAFLINSEPSLYQFDQFDGPFLADNLNCSQKRSNIPTEMGIYKCKIMYHGLKYFTGDGYEYDVDCWMEDAVKIELPK